MIYGFSFSDLRCQNPALGVAVEVEHLAVLPWSWTIEVQAPKVRIEPRTSVDTTVVAADIELPIAFYPTSARQPVHSIGSWARRRSWRRTGAARIAQ